MTLDEIKAAVEEGHKVHWVDDGYEVVVRGGDCFIDCAHNQNGISLVTRREGVTMNGKPEDFFVGHVWGPFENARFTGEPHRKCRVPGCRAITLDGDDEQLTEKKGD